MSDSTNNYKLITEDPLKDYIHCSTSRGRSLNVACPYFLGHCGNRIQCHGIMPPTSFSSEKMDELSRYYRNDNYYDSLVRVFRSPAQKDVCLSYYCRNTFPDEHGSPNYMNCPIYVMLESLDI